MKRWPEHGCSADPGTARLASPRSNSAARRRASAPPNRFRYRQQTRSLSRSRLSFFSCRFPSCKRLCSRESCIEKSASIGPTTSEYSFWKQRAFRCSKVGYETSGRRRVVFVAAERLHLFTLTRPVEPTSDEFHNALARRLWKSESLQPVCCSNYTAGSSFECYLGVRRAKPACCRG